VLAWLSVWSEVQMICIWSSWCHCHPIISCFIEIQIGLTFLVPAYPGCWKRPLNGCLSVLLWLVWVRGRILLYYTVMPLWCRCRNDNESLLSDWVDWISDSSDSSSDDDTRHRSCTRYATTVSYSQNSFISERERPSVVCRPSSVTLVRPTQVVQIFGNISTALGTLATHSHSLKISRRSSQGNPSAAGVKHKRGSQV